jgi:hypothetical protein
MLGYSETVIFVNWQEIPISLIDPVPGIFERYGLVTPI